VRRGWESLLNITEMQSRKEAKIFYAVSGQCFDRARDGGYKLR